MLGSNKRSRNFRFTPPRCGVSNLVLEEILTRLLPMPHQRNDTRHCWPSGSFPKEGGPPMAIRSAHRYHHVPAQRPDSRKAQMIAVHESLRTTKPFDCRSDDITLDED